MRKRVRNIAACLLTGSIICILGLFAWKPFTNRNADAGFVKFYWSGLSALFDDRPFGIRRNYYMQVNLGGYDGPYIFQTDSLNTIYYVTGDNEVRRDTPKNIDSLLVRVDDTDTHNFYIKPAEIIKETSVYAMPEKLIALSDIEGNFYGFYSFLIANKIMNEQFEWTFGDGHLVLLGDYVDRGTEVTQVLWLIYKLEQDALKAGGKVHYVLGNHEILNLQAKPGYANEKYIKIAQVVSGKTNFSDAYKTLYGSGSFFNKWLRSKNAIVKIGNNIFAHGGISPKLLSFQPSLDAINSSVRANAQNDLHHYPSRNLFDNFVNGKEGIYWYRGMAAEYKKQDKVTVKEFKDILTWFNAEKIIIGHTIGEDVLTDYNGRLIKIDVLHEHEKFTGKTKGILINGNETYKIDDLGKKVKL